MDDRCKHCPLLCKRLNSEDDPARYSFQRLTPQQVISMVDSGIKRSADRHCLQVKQCECSLGDQLAVLLSLGYRQDAQENKILLIAQAANVNESQTDLWFRYGLPDSLCDDRSASEISSMIVEVLENIGQCDWLLSK